MQSVFTLKPLSRQLLAMSAVWISAVLGSQAHAINTTHVSESALSVLMSSAGSSTKNEAVSSQAEIDQAAILQTYAKQAYAMYEASLKDARQLQEALRVLSTIPSQQTLDAAKQAWLSARESYGLTEAFRLSGGPIDAEEGWVNQTYGALESQINAWPLDEYMIDYIVDADGKRTSGNIIDSTGEFLPQGEGAQAIDITQITKDVLSALNENGGEANVTSGYHAIEFLLWGQDQDYSNFIDDAITQGATTAGQRPVSDFTEDKFAARRLAYLQAAADKLVDDLTIVTDAWAPELSGNKGLYRAAFLAQLSGEQADKNIETKQALRQIMAGLGVFMKSELANERIAVAVLTPSEEDEHSCFSDNTHRDIVQNFKGFVDILKGQYQGQKMGPALFDTLSEQDQSAIAERIEAIEKRLDKMDGLAKSTMHFDYQIMPQHEAESRNIISMKNAMRKLGDQMVIVAKALKIDLSEDDVTDAEETKV